MPGKDKQNHTQIQQMPQQPVDINEFIKSLPHDKQEIASQLIFAMEESIETSYKGPIPPPDYLKGYKDVLPNAPERIFTMVEEQQKHRIAMEKMIMERNLGLSDRGQILGFIIVVLFLVAAVYLALDNHETLACIIMGTTLLGVLVVFVLNKLPWFNKDSDEIKTEEKPQ